MIEHIQKIIIDYIEANNISNINNTDITIKPTKSDYDGIYEMQKRRSVDKK